MHSHSVKVSFVNKIVNFTRYNIHNCFEFSQSVSFKIKMNQILVCIGIEYINRFSTGVLIKCVHINCIYGYQTLNPKGNLVYRPFSYHIISSAMILNLSSSSMRYIQHRRLLLVCKIIICHRQSSIRALMIVSDKLSIILVF